MLTLKNIALKQVKGFNERCINTSVCKSSTCTWFEVLTDTVNEIPMHVYSRTTLTAVNNVSVIYICAQLV